MQGGYGAVFAVQVQILLSTTRVAVQAVSKPEIYHGAEFKLRADARVRVQQSLQICLERRSKSKKCDKQLTHIVRVIFRPVLKLYDFEKLSLLGYFIDLMNSPAVMTGILLSLKSC